MTQLAASPARSRPVRLAQGLLSLLVSLYSRRELIWRLAVHELRTRYAATLGGTVWAVANPIAVILVFWFVSVYGLRLTGERGTPFFLVLFCGLVPWMTFQEALTGGAGSVVNHAYLVKKIAFPLEVLPVVSIVSAAIVHGVLLGLLVLILLVSGVPPSFHMLQVGYVLLALLVFTLGLSWLLSALNAFHPDVGQALGPIMTTWFWATPIVWPSDNLSASVLSVVQLNPIYYVVQGYRNALIYHRSVFALWPLDLYFWAVTALCFLGGAFVFRRLKLHFAEVL